MPKSFLVRSRDSDVNPNIAVDLTRQSHMDLKLNIKTEHSDRMAKLDGARADQMDIEIEEKYSKENSDPGLLDENCNKLGKYMCI